MEREDRDIEQEEENAWERKRTTMKILKKKRV